MSSTSGLLLERRNKHPRDAKLEFDEPTHVYTIDGDSDYTSVTTLIHRYFEKFDADLIISRMFKKKTFGPGDKYYDMIFPYLCEKYPEKSESMGRTIKSSKFIPGNKYYDAALNHVKDSWNENGRLASELGTEMHLNIEYYYNEVPYRPGFTETPEYELFVDYLKDNPYQAYRTEWAVFAKKYKLAGSIDMIYCDPDDPDSYMIADWKRSKEIKFKGFFGKKGKHPVSEFDDCNFSHYSLQLNIYKLILENYYGETALMIAKRLKNAKIEKLIASKTKKEAKNENQTATYKIDKMFTKNTFNLVENEDVDGLKLYLDTHPGMDINVKNKKGNTVLLLAVKRQNVDLVKVLLEYPGINLAAVDRKNISKMFLVILHPNQDKYMKIPVKNLKTEAMALLNDHLKTIT